MKNKKIIFLALIMQITFTASFAQINITTIKVMDNGSVVYAISVADVDSIYFTNQTVSNSISGVAINGVVWATRNVDAPGTFCTNPEDYGMLYQWNRPIGWSSSDPMTNSNGGTIWDSSMPTGDTWEESNNVCPTGWRIPTEAEITSLNNSGSVWTTVNGVNGRIYGSGETVVFFPAVADRYDNDGSLNYQSSYRYYWSATAIGVSGAYTLYFNSSSSYITNGSRNYGFSVRCVAE
ncbi:MAG: fibrobacter succinogenes major paralogous domain-containing protein [Bacteroidales bacterium]|jgi:uncharacterized protein (TIGR02145 family)|nr:fibrobacter succinogenes major paralogous domain-containing protein [Bacteroidales bacterium]